MKTLLLNDLTDIELQMLNLATKVRENAYAPYSHYKVGAAILGIDGEIYTGCNVESADFTLTSHAECVAIDSMVKHGCHEIKLLLIVLESLHLPSFPCGLCRQKASEFTEDNDLKIISVNLDSESNISKIYETSLSELLPNRFTSDNFLNH
ncbi:MAG: cytidine deaminase [Candidatus Kapabacteria bacterium]|nr:cytidine deaminase [Candidatus Kapabacteria bacterium]